MMGRTYVVSVKITDDNTIEVVKRQPSNSMYLCSPPRPRPIPDTVYKEVYGVLDGKIQLMKTITGRHEPAKQVNEKFIFEDD